jgi:ribulose 1,5-bisphosphate synthetase/thiazole synthase
VFFPYGFRFEKQTQYWNTKMSQGYDVAVIYSGPVGYATATRCAQKDASVAMVEKRRNEF